MSKLHVLTGNLSGNYLIVSHQATPGGNNTAGFAWSACLVADHHNTSALQPVAGPALGVGEILQTEYDAIVAGTVIEDVFSFTDDGQQAGETLQNYLIRIGNLLNAQASQRQANQINDLSAKYKWYGQTVA